MKNSDLGDKPKERRGPVGHHRRQLLHYTGQVTSKPDPELARLQQVEEGCVSPTAGMWTRESSPKACRRVTQAGPGVTSPMKARATKQDLDAMLCAVAEVGTGIVAVD